MKTMQEEWRAYRDACYPNGTTAIQNREYHQAFFTGAFIMIGLCNEISALPEDQAVAALQKVGDEVHEIILA